MTKQLKPRFSGPSRDLYQEATDRILQSMEAGILPWVKPWHSVPAADGRMPYNVASRKSYRGCNVFFLWQAQIARGYDRPAWLTFKQARDLGGNVRDGENKANGKGGTKVYLFKPMVSKDKKTGEDKKWLMLREFTVFNIAQCENLPESVMTGNFKPRPPRNNDGRDSMAEDFIAATGADFSEGGDKACFIPALDSVLMPKFEDFNSADHYYSTAFHELTHWTGPKKRLDRDLSGRFGTKAYAAEELIAEMGSAFLCAEFGIDGMTQHHAAYLQNWIELLKEDNRALFTAASKAQAAVDFMRGIAIADAGSTPAAEAGEEPATVLEAA